jgi:hypothetical protein
MFRNNPDFYPTDVNTINLMGIDCYGKVVLEPSAGKNDIVNYLKDNGAKEVLSCEFNKDLAEIVKTKSKFLKHDFLKVTPEEVSHIDMIVANPPFSNGDKHVLHMWNIAPDGCEILSLINYDTYKNSYSNFHSELKQIIHDYGCIIELGEVFSNSERKTEVNVGLIKLYKPKRNEFEFEGFFMDEDDEEPQGNGIMKFDAIKDIVQRYVYSVKCFEEFEVIKDRMNGLTNLFGVEGFKFSIGRENNVYNKSDFKKEIQKKAWTYIFGKMNLNKYLTSGVMKDINKFCENQQNVPFTMKNIYKMFEYIIGNSNNIFERALVEACDNFTRYTKENRYSLEGWASNEGHMLNRKIIIPYICEKGWTGKIDVKYGNNADNLKDLNKVICSLTATNFNNIICLDRMVRYKYQLYVGDKFIEKLEDDSSYSWAFSDKLEDVESIRKKLLNKGIKAEIREVNAEFGKWLDWGFFEIRFYKKGTAHLKFKEVKTWELVNRAYAKAKGQVLPEKFKFKEPKESKNKKETGLELIKY